jgi:hypothetical protein
LRDNLEVFYDLSTTDFCPDKEWWPWWEEPYKRETTVIPHISIFYDYFYILQFFSAKRIKTSLTI